jgi:hypothetical protein
VKRFGDDEQSSAGANRRISGSIELSFMDPSPVHVNLVLVTDK